MNRHTYTKILILALWISTMLAEVFSPNLQAQSELIEPKSRALWGRSKVNCTDGNHVYIGAGGTIIIGKIISVDSINIVNEYYLPSTVQDLSIRGNTLFVSDLLSGLHILDLTDIFRPKEIGRLKFNHRCYGLLLDSSLVFISHGTGFSKVNISNPTNPVLIDTARFPCTQLRTYSDYLYCISNGLITIVQSSTLDSVGAIPLRIITPFGNWIAGLEFSISKAILVENYFGDLPNHESSILTILDISTPTTPLRCGSLELPLLSTFKNKTDTVFSLTRDTLIIIDITSFNRPFLVSKTYGINGDFISLGDSMLFASRDYFSEFQVVNIKNIHNLKKGYYLSTLADIGSIFANDSFLVAGRFNYPGLLLVDISNPLKPRTRYSYAKNIGSVRGISMNKGHIFAASGQGLKVFDVVNLDSLKLIGELNYGGWATRIDVSDTIVALGGGYSPIHLISVANPTQPKYILCIPSSSFGYMNDIFIRDTLLFVCGDYAGVRIYSVSSPNQPIQLWERYYSSCEAIFPFGNILLVADYMTLRAFDITTPRNPIEVGSFRFDRRIIDISVRDSLAFVALFSNSYSENNGMVILDISSLNSMKEIARANTPGWPNAIFATDSFVFLSDHDNGVCFYNYSDILTQVPELLSTAIPDTYKLFQNYPNPFNTLTKIDFTLSRHTFTTLRIYDLLGREIATLLNEFKTPGTHSVYWDASQFASGVYLYRLQTNKYTETRKLILLK